MARYTRSEFLRPTGTSVAAGVFGASTRARAQSGGTVDASRPDLELVNGRVSTMDDSLLRAETFAVKNRRFVAVEIDSDAFNEIKIVRTVVGGRHHASTGVTR